LPVIVGASALKGVRLATREYPAGIRGAMAAGAAAAFSSTLVSMRLIAMLERSRSLLPYVAYRTALGTAALFALHRRARARAGVPAALNGDRAAAPGAGPNGRVHPAVIQ
jgi:undecaprenyl-diphosphatase